MDYTVREATIEDLDVLVPFVSAEAFEAEGLTLEADTVSKGISFGLKNKNIAMYWVVETSDGRVIGNISTVKEWSDWNAGFYWWIQSIYVLPEHRGKNVVRLLLEQVNEKGREEGAIDLRLYVHADNHRAIKAYVREGFAELNYKIMRLAISRES